MGSRSPYAKAEAAEQPHVRALFVERAARYAGVSGSTSSSGMYSRSWASATAP